MIKPRADALTAQGVNRGNDDQSQGVPSPERLSLRLQSAQLLLAERLGRSELRNFRMDWATTANFSEQGSYG
jgi:hypothetical protein